MTLALVAAVVVSALLFAPFSVEFTLERGARRRWDATPRWAGLGLPRSSRARPAARARVRSRRRGAAGSFRKLRALVASPDFLASLARLGRRVLRELRPRHLQLRLKLGLGDPADTGRAWGALTPLWLALTRVEADELRLEPDFLRRSFDLEARGVVRVVPGVLVALVVGYLLTPPPWRALCRYVRA